MDKVKHAVIGSNTLIELVGVATDVPAKVDTGADSSAIWASGVSVDKHGTLHYVLFDRKSPFYSGTIYKTKHFTVASVLSSTGHREIRYRVGLPTRIANRRVRVQFNLSNRATHKFPVLIGRRTLKNKFIVDVAQQTVKLPIARTHELNKEMQENPHAFFQKYHQSKGNK